MSQDSHLDTDALATLAAALEWRHEEWLEHLIGCEVCGGTLSRLSAVRQAMDAELEPASGFEDRVMASLEEAAEAERARREAAGVLWSVLIPALATATTFAGLLFAGVTVGPLPVALVSLVTGGAVWAWNLKQSAALAGSLS